MTTSALRVKTSHHLLRDTLLPYAYYTAWFGERGSRGADGTHAAALWTVQARKDTPMWVLHHTSEHNHTHAEHPVPLYRA